MTLQRAFSLFNTIAWKQAWLDTWGNDARIEVLDIGGRKNPCEMLYRVKQRLKKIIPARSLHLVGVGSSVLSTPRAEYNQATFLLNANLSAAINSSAWDQFYLPDIVVGSATDKAINECLSTTGYALVVNREESAYCVQASQFSNYLAGLGANTRLSYFNRRERLATCGTVEMHRFTVAQAPQFFQLLNQFHVVRWGVPCYSDQSQQFLQDFFTRLVDQGGEVILESMSVNGEVVSVLEDVVLDGCRYNFQSGYCEDKFPKIALGAIHMGYGIQAAIEAGQVYDFMAGTGKHANYKARIATHEIPIKSVVLERGPIKYLRRIQGVVNGIK